MERLFMYESEDELDEAAENVILIRQFPHAKGQWAVHIYAEYVYSTLDLADRLPGRNVDTLHISLSRCFPSRLHFIRHMITETRDLCKNFGSISCKFTKLALFQNDTLTMFFIGACVESHGKLDTLVDGLDRIISSYKGPEFYKNRRFHVSLKCLNNVNSKLYALMNAESNKLLNLAPFVINEIVFKYGNQFVKIPLSSID